MDLISCRNLLIYLGPRYPPGKFFPIFHLRAEAEGALVFGDVRKQSAPFFEPFFLVDR